MSEIKPIIAVVATNPDCARIAKRTGADIIYVSALNYARHAAQKQGKLVADPSSAGYPNETIIQIPNISRGEYNPWQYVSKGNQVYVESIGTLFHSYAIECIPHVGPALGILNADTLATVANFGVSIAWLSPELNIAQISQIARDVKKKVTDSQITLGVKVAGAQELMVCEHCILASEGECDENCESCRRRTKRRALEDRKGYKFPVVTDAAGRSHVYNSVALDVIADIAQLVNAGVCAFCIDATLMSEEETAHAVGRLRKALELAEVGESLPKASNTTSGHFHRGIS